MNQEKKNIQQINIELDEKVSAGEYANFVVVTHSPAEFVMDFTRILPGVPKAKVHSRIIMAPQHAKAYLAALNDNIKKFESKHGEIKMPSREEGFSSFGVNVVCFWHDILLLVVVFGLSLFCLLFVIVGIINLQDIIFNSI